MAINRLTKKLIIVVNASAMRLFAAHGTRIIDEVPKVMPHYPRPLHQRQPKHQGYYGKSKTQSHFFDPHHGWVRLIPRRSPKISF